MLVIDRHIPYFCRSVIALALLLLLASCSREDVLPPDDGEESSDYVTLEFTMLTRNGATDPLSRAGIPAPPNPETGSGAENYLDLENLVFLLFDGQQKMLRAFSPEISVLSGGSAPYVKYSVKTFLHDKYFLHATDEYITFTIVTLGNHAGLSPDSFNYHIGQELREIFDAEKVGTFAIPVSNNISGTWVPAIAPFSGQDSGHIPMAGMQTFTVTTAALKSSTPDRPYKLSEGVSARYINMLRALAKIEIIDNMPPLTADGDGYEIERVELVGHATRGAILPNFSEWSATLETQYVSRPSVPVSSEYRGATPVSGLATAQTDDDAVINFFTDSDAAEARGDGCSVHSCYITEYDPDKNGAIPDMWMRVTVKSHLTGKTTQFRLEAAPYSDGRPGEPLKILRNNIYRYVITGANEISLDIQPFANKELSFGFGLLRDTRGDLMVLPDKDGNYPDYFINFLEKQGHPKVEDVYGHPTDEDIELTDGDYYAIVVGENEEMSQASLWVKDAAGCHVLSNLGSEDDSQSCMARLVESFYNNTESEKFYKDKFGYRRVYHFNNHNSIVRHPKRDNLLFCLIENFHQSGETRRYFEVESWDDTSSTGWIVTKDEAGTETGFQKITSEGTLGETVPLN